MRRLNLLVGIACLSTLQGCFFYTQPKQKFYALFVARGASGGATKEVSLSVVPLRIHPNYENQNFVYRLSNERLESDYYNLFLSAPDANITEQLKSWLRRGNRFKSVTGITQSTTSDYVLSGSVESLYGDFSNAKAPYAVISLRGSLVNSSSGARKALGPYERRIPLANQTPNGLVAAWNKALISIFGDMEKDVLAQIP